MDSSTLTEKLKDFKKLSLRRLTAIKIKKGTMNQVVYPWTAYEAVVDNDTTVTYQNVQLTWKPPRSNYFNFNSLLIEWESVTPTPQQANAPTSFEMPYQEGGFIISAGSAPDLRTTKIIRCKFLNSTITWTLRYGLLENLIQLPTKDEMTDFLAHTCGFTRFYGEDFSQAQQASDED